MSQSQERLEQLHYSGHSTAAEACHATPAEHSAYEHLPSCLKGACLLG